MGDNSIILRVILIGTKLLPGCECTELILLRGQFFQAVIFLMSLKSQTWIPQFKVPLGGLCSLKNPSTSTLFESVNWVSRKMFYPKSTIYKICVINKSYIQIICNKLFN